jgi:hypothetical protein
VGDPPPPLTSSHYCLYPEAKSTNQHVLSSSPLLFSMANIALRDF